MEIVDKPTRTQRNGKVHHAQTGKYANGRMGKQAKKVIRDVREMGSTARNIALEKLGSLRESASERKNEGQDRVQQAEHSIEQFMADHPVKTVLIAAGAGLLLGRLWMRR